MRRSSLFLTVVGTLLTQAAPLRAGDLPDSPQPKPLKTPEGELRRRAMFGARLAPVTKDVRERQKLDGDDGVVLEKIFPDTSAAEAGFKDGDVILAVGGAKVTGVPAFLKRMAEARAGDVLTFEVVRDAVKAEKKVTLKEMPREKGDGYDVIYSSVSSRGARQRTIITRPKGEGRHPAVLLLQGGHTCFPVDTPVGQPAAFTWIAGDLTRLGYVTMRVERPGCGDSEGGPLRDVDFDTELDGYKEALRALQKLDFVDADNVFLFGHSMGGIVAPLIAIGVPVRGIAVYGTGAGTWFEAVFGQRRRLASLDGTKPAEVNAEILRQARFWYPLVAEKRTPREILERDPELKQLGWVTDDVYVGERHYKFHHQLADKNLTEAWTKVAETRLSVGGKVPAAPVQPRVLAIWGTSDWLVDKASNEWIAEVVNRAKRGNGKFVALDAIDHFFFRAVSPEESYKLWKPVKGAPPGEFNPVLLETLRSWLDATAGRAKQEPGKR
jgi:pimeloyl-ACP methyl ester carboxylesterase